MSTDLERFRDHARQMATAEHVPACGVTVTDRWGWSRWVSPDPDCAGCVTDRHLWIRLADETDTYLDRNQDMPLEGTA
jgi:hypothetical protein